MSPDEINDLLLAKWTRPVACPTCEVDQARVNPSTHRDEDGRRYIMRLRCHECHALLRTLELKDGESEIRRPGPSIVEI